MRRVDRSKICLSFAVGYFAFLAIDQIVYAEPNQKCCGADTVCNGCKSIGVGFIDLGVNSANTGQATVVPQPTASCRSKVQICAVYSGNLYSDNICTIITGTAGPLNYNESLCDPTANNTKCQAGP